MSGTNLTDALSNNQMKSPRSYPAASGPELAVVLGVPSREASAQALAGAVGNVITMPGPGRTSARWSRLVTRCGACEAAMISHKCMNKLDFIDFTR
jgi:hypothetical protein